MEPAGRRRARHDRDAGRCAARVGGLEPGADRRAAPRQHRRRVAVPFPDHAGAARRAHASQSDSGDAPQRHASVSRGSGRAARARRDGLPAHGQRGRLPPVAGHLDHLHVDGRRRAARQSRRRPVRRRHDHHPVGLWRRAHVAFAGAARPVRAPAGLPHRRGELGLVRDGPGGQQPRRHRRRLVAALQHPDHSRRARDADRDSDARRDGADRFRLLRGVAHGARPRRRHVADPVAYVPRRPRDGAAVAVGHHGDRDGGCWRQRRSREHGAGLPRHGGEPAARGDAHQLRFVSARCARTGRSR